MFYILVIALIIVDQIIKIVVRANLSLNSGFDVIGDYFKITYIENPGMAFGMMAGNSIFLVLIPIALMVLIFILWKKYGKNYRKLVDVSVAMILAGGISNLFDRIFLGSVTDYLNLKWFAVFNFADICATLGCVLLCITICFLEKKDN